MRLAQADGSAPDLDDITLPGGVYRKISIYVKMNYQQRWNGYSYDTPSTDENIDVTVDPSGYMTISLVVKLRNVTSVTLQVKNLTIELSEWLIYDCFERLMEWFIVYRLNKWTSKSNYWLNLMINQSIYCQFI